MDGHAGSPQAQEARALHLAGDGQQEEPRWRRLLRLRPSLRLARLLAGRWRRHPSLQHPAARLGEQEAPLARAILLEVALVNRRVLALDRLDPRARPGRLPRRPRLARRVLPPPRLLLSARLRAVPARTRARGGPPFPHAAHALFVVVLLVLLVVLSQAPVQLLLAPLTPLTGVHGVQLERLHPLLRRLLLLLLLLLPPVVPGASQRLLAQLCRHHGIHHGPAVAHAPRRVTPGLGRCSSALRGLQCGVRATGSVSHGCTVLSALNCWPMVQSRRHSTQLGSTWPPAM